MNEGLHVCAPLQSPRLLLRQPVPGDAAALLTILQNENVSRFWPGFDTERIEKELISLDSDVTVFDLLPSHVSIAGFRNKLVICPTYQIPPLRLSMDRQSGVEIVHVCQAWFERIVSCKPQARHSMTSTANHNQKQQNATQSFAVNCWFGFEFVRFPHDN